MRIISGKHRGAKLFEFDGQDIRPTSDRAKVSLFNILGDFVVDSKVLDLFCGSGALGLECLSRGASSVTFCDNLKSSIDVLKKNLAKLKETANVNLCDYSIVLSAKKQYDLIFIDPPYASDVGILAIKYIAKNDMLTQNGILVFERDIACEINFDGLEKYDERKYGKAYLSFFRRVL